MNPSPSSPPLVSVLMAVYNGERYLREAVDGVLAQTFTDFEFVIVDDGSTDRTAAILDSYSDPRIRRITNPANVGLTKSLNIGLARCTGRYIARQDDDDVSRPERLARQVEFLEAHPDVVLLGCGWQWIDEAGRVDPQPVIPLLGDRALRWNLLLQNGFRHSSVMWRQGIDGGRHAVAADGSKSGADSPTTLLRADAAPSRDRLEYDESLRYAQDYGLWSALMRRGRAANLAEPLVLIRNHANAITFARYQEQQACADQIALENLRAAGFSGLSLEDVSLMRRPAANVHGRDRWRRIELLGRVYRTTDYGLRTTDGKGEEAEWRRVRRAFKRDLIKAALWPPKYREAIGAWWEVVRMVSGDVGL